MGESMPKESRGITRIFLIRHGVSSANLDPTQYQLQPDHTIPLADPIGDATCLTAGKALTAAQIDPGSLRVWHSPYLRCQQTRDLVMRAAFPPDLAGASKTALPPSRESFLLREQEFGDWDGLSEEELAARDPVRFEKRKKMHDAYGRFYFRYPFGESRADVVQRITLFLAKLHRSEADNHVIFLHGVTQRAFRMAWFNHAVDWFEREPNPKNGSVLMIERAVAGGQGISRDSGEASTWTETYIA
jgi:broad specificity phosphatase PhoE